ncbi:hypothetical protein Tco_0747105 [Tanacetum coccineum]
MRDPRDAFPFIVLSPTSLVLPLTSLSLDLLPCNLRTLLVHIQKIPKKNLDVLKVHDKNLDLLKVPLKNLESLKFKNNQRYEDLVDHWRRTHTDRTGRFHSGESEEPGADPKH